MSKASIQEKKEFPRSHHSKSDKAAIDYFAKRDDVVITKAEYLKMSTSIKTK